MKLSEREGWGWDLVRRESSCIEINLKRRCKGRPTNQGDRKNQPPLG